MRLLLLVLLLQLVYTVQAFYRLGTVGVGSTSGTIYLIDSNSLFLRGFRATEALVFRGGSGSTLVTATTSGALSNVNMMLDGNNDWLEASPIEIRTASGDELITSFDIPGNIQIPCTAEYLGRFTRGGASTLHSLSGHVFFDSSNRRLFVAGLNLDGSAPAAYMWLSTSTTPSGGGRRTGYNGRYGKVDDVNNQDANVTYPVPLSDVQVVYRSLSVWCVDFSVSFGHVVIPEVTDSFGCSTSYGSVKLGDTPAKHGVSANVYVLGPNTIGLQNMNYGGDAPGTWYWAGTTSDVHTGFIVADETGSLGTLSEISNANVVLTLPTDYDVCNTNFFSVYCVIASVSFGEVFFDSSYGCTNCPQICKTVGEPGPVFQCKDLSSTEQIEYRYDSNNSLVTFRFHTCNLEANEYFAFGISASNSGVAMSPNGDVAVCQYSTTGVVDCSDYDLTIRSQCALSGGSYNGACPDTVLTGGVNNYINTQVETINALTTFTTTRAVNTTDSHDKVYTPGTPQYIIWARGGTFSSPTSERWVLRHASDNRISSSAPIQIDFAANQSCTRSLLCPTTTPAPKAPWKVPPICIEPDNNQINAAIGNTGGVQGYKGITGKDGWGIAWYLNGYLIPEVYVLRGTTVRFYVNGGNDPDDSASYHPLYITSSNEGGINVLQEAGESITETVYAGLDYNQAAQTVTDLTVGPYCEWEETEGGGDNFNSFSRYEETLEYSCSSTVLSGIFEWTANTESNGPFYYQCATHRLLGWKIYVVDDLEECFALQSAAYQTLSYALLLFIGVVLTIFYAL
ncbi:Protein Skeletor, isoforms B/C [Oopsacas minuta]|uniref:Protein Skeletor, isoforms B/C n=1 Tax=Oopsacas minuta TaxID=111878 RepID=A0AAV7KL11_9METZ|nr:Protein Skeletor, isoforms B/C [Oopsacas minuta]